MAEVGGAERHWVVVLPGPNRRRVCGLSHPPLFATFALCAIVIVVVSSRIDSHIIVVKGKVVFGAAAEPLLAVPPILRSALEDQNESGAGDGEDSADEAWGGDDNGGNLTLRKRVGDGHCGGRRDG